MYKQGVILEIRDKEAVVFNNSGEYEKIEKIEGMYVGQLVEYKKTSKRNMNKFISAISAAAVLIVIFFSYSIFQSSREQVFAYVALDINPSMEFSISKENHVLGLKPLNHDAEKITKVLKVKGKNIDLALSDVMGELKRLEFIGPKSENIIILSTSASALWDENDKRNIQINHTMTSLKEVVIKCTNNHAHVETISATPEMRNLSIKSDMSLGRYALYKKALDKGRGISLQEAKIAPLSKLIGCPQYSVNNSSKSVNGKSNSDDNLETDTDDVNKSIDKNGKVASKNTESDVATTNAKTKADPIPNVEKYGPTHLHDTNLPKHEEAGQLPPEMPGHTNKTPNTTPDSTEISNVGAEQKDPPDANLPDKKKGASMPPTSRPPEKLPGEPMPARPPMALPSGPPASLPSGPPVPLPKPGNIGEQKPDPDMPGNAGGEGRRFRGGDTNNRRGAENGVKFDREPKKEP